MTIGQCAQITGLSAKALRLYDERGLLAPAEIDATNGYRRYHHEQVRRGAQLAVLRRMGVSLELAGHVLSDPDRTTRGGGGAPGGAAGRQSRSGRPTG